MKNKDNFTKRMKNIKLMSIIIDVLTVIIGIFCGFIIAYYIFIT